MNGFRSKLVESKLMIPFKCAQYPKDVILFAVFFYVRYSVSYRDIEEIMSERGVSVDHTTLNRWVTRYSGAIAGVIPVLVSAPFVVERPASLLCRGDTASCGS